MRGRRNDHNFGRFSILGEKKIGVILKKNNVMALFSLNFAVLLVKSGNFLPHFCENIF
jgi:hypothetical protein